MAPATVPSFSVSNKTHRTRKMPRCRHPPTTNKWTRRRVNHTPVSCVLARARRRNRKQFVRNMHSRSISRCRCRRQRPLTCMTLMAVLPLLIRGRSRLLIVRCLRSQTSAANRRHRFSTGIGIRPPTSITCRTSMGSSRRSKAWSKKRTDQSSTCSPKCIRCLTHRCRARPPRS